MPGIDIELNPVTFITVGTVGPKGKRVFYLQAGRRDQITSLIIEKEQSWALSEAIKEFLQDLESRFSQEMLDDFEETDVGMHLREPIEPLFRVAQMGLGYDEKQDKIVLIAQELVATEESESSPEGVFFEEDDPPPSDGPPPSVVRMWCTRSQMEALSQQAMRMVESGRADPKQNGRIIYYWT